MITDYIVAIKSRTVPNFGFQVFGPEDRQDPLAIQ